MLLRVTNVTRNKVLADRAERATSFSRRFVGLMGRKNLPLGEALHILPCNSIHTFFMRIPIDVLFLDPDDVILRATSAMVPWRASSIIWKCRSVLELPAGVIHASGTVAGDRLSFAPHAAGEVPPFPN